MASKSNRGVLLSLPPRLLHRYDEYVAKNASQVSQIESALRSLTYIIPGRFRDAEIASETIHSSVQLLSLYHDSLLQRVLSSSSSSPSSSSSSSTTNSSLPAPSLHTRYTRFWQAKSALYRRVALALQVVQYTELLCEMAAKRRGEKMRWRVVVLLEAIKALCKLILLRVTRFRPLLTPALPERQPVPEPAEEDGDEEGKDDLGALMRALDDDDDDDDNKLQEEDAQVERSNPLLLPPSPPPSPPSTKGIRLNSQGRAEWTMPRTGLSLPSLPQPGDTASYLLSRVLTADDIKPASKLLLPTTASGAAAQAAEILHILAPLIYAIALARSCSSQRSKDNKGGGRGTGAGSWTPWLIGLGVELAARQLRDRSMSRATALEREEWSRRGWGMGWWAMRGAFYENVTKVLVGGVRGKVLPAFVGGVVEDYEYLWENYYFSTSG